MTTIAEAAATPRTEHHGGDLPRGLRWTVHDSWNEATRHMRALPRNIDMLVFATLQPIMFVLLFRYVFGGSIEIPGFSYNQYLMPGSSPRPSCSARRSPRSARRGHDEGIFAFLSVRRFMSNARR